MRAKIVRIGNSQGVRIPKLLIERSGLGGEVEIEAEENRIVLTAVRRPRDGWNEAFRAMSAAGDDRLVDGDPSAQTRFDEEEWEW